MFLQVSAFPQSASWILIQCSGFLWRCRNASYWNAFLFCHLFLSSCMNSNIGNQTTHLRNCVDEIKVFVIYCPFSCLKFSSKSILRTKCVYVHYTCGLPLHKLAPNTIRKSHTFLQFPVLSIITATVGHTIVLKSTIVLNSVLP